MTLPAETTAPGYDPGAVGLPWYRRAMAQGAGYFLPSLAFLVIPLMFAGDMPAWQRAVLVVLVLAVGVFFAGSTLVMHFSHAARWLWLAGLMLAITGTAWLTDQPETPAYMASYVTCAAATLLPWRDTRILIPAYTVFGLGLAAYTATPIAAILALTGASIGIPIALGFENDRTREALRRAEERTALLAVAAERERIGRDLHDILGHSLTTIAVKADLAARLVGREPAAAQQEIADLAKVARHALADVRSTASGIRQVTLAGEIAAARSVLTAAGIECRSPNALPPMDTDRSELLGYVVREAVTNVVRHSGAALCVIEAGADGVEITDDGRGLRNHRGGSGIAGLQERVAAGGGRLEVGPAPSGQGTRVKAEFGEDA